MKGRTKVLLLCALLIYIVAGGGVFHVLERNHEKAAITEANKQFQQFLANKTCLEEEELKKLMTQMFEAYNRGVLDSLNSTDSPATNWDLYSSLFFATTVVTSVGYGNISPTVTESRLFCALYAILGIPLCLVVLAQVGSSIYHGIRKFSDLISKCFKKRINFSKSTGTLIADVINILLGILILFIIPSVIFMYTEGWSFGIGLYYCVISLSTVGFGDFVAGLENDTKLRGFYRLMLSIWLLIGLAWFASIVTLIQDHITESVKKKRAHMESMEKKLKNMVFQISLKADNAVDTKL